jgi:folate-binding Fe-S cluster repair protein YgfZ
MDAFGADFKKGHVGREVVSRMKHRGLVRKRCEISRARRRARARRSDPPGDVEIGVTSSRLHEGVSP